MKKLFITLSFFALSIKSTPCAEILASLLKYRVEAKHKLKAMLELHNDIIEKNNIKNSVAETITRDFEKSFEQADNVAEGLEVAYIECMKK